MLNKEKYQLGYKRFESLAKKYVDNPKKTAKLINKTKKKAKNNKGSLAKVWNNFQLLTELLKSWSTGEYRNISKKSIVFIIASILYFVSPIDIIPDFLFGIGIIDDAAVISFAIKQLSGEIEKYHLWKQNTVQNEGQLK